jgi:hypothetical protein
MTTAVGAERVHAGARGKDGAAAVEKRAIERVHNNNWWGTQAFWEEEN